MWGWEPSTTTVYEYDQDGRLVGAVSTPEAEWDIESYGLLAGLADWEDSLCPRCGHPLAECMDPAADVNNPGRTHEYKGRPVGRCHACEALRAAQAPYAEDRDTHIETWHFTVDRAERVPPAPRRRTGKGTT